MKKYMALVLTLALMLCTACNSGIIENEPPIDETLSDGVDWTPGENQLTVKQTEAVTTVTTTVTTVKPEPEIILKNGYGNVNNGFNSTFTSQGKWLYYTTGRNIVK